MKILKALLVSLVILALVVAFEYSNCGGIRHNFRLAKRALIFSTIALYIAQLVALI